MSKEEAKVPRIAILMAIYEPRMDWLEAQLRSLDAQTYPNLRLYIRDDCSPTVSLDAIAACVKEYIHAFPFELRRNEKNLGSNGTFERLTLEAEGDYFAYCDQDDVWLPEKLEVLHAAMAAEEALLVCSDMFIIDGEGRQTADSITKARGHHVFKSGEGLAPGLMIRNFATGCTMLVDARAAREAVPFCPYMVHDHYLALWCAAGAWLCAALVFGPMKSPLVNLGCLVKDGIDFQRLRIEAGGQVDPDAARFYRDGVADGRIRPEALPQRPNVVLLFVEGLSQSVLEDARDLMPNLAALERRTLFFENYYNHTFATYRVLISQLYSGYQLSDQDANGLVSLQAILHDFGYRTAFINTEPNNAQFTEYLAAMGFDDFISSKDWVTQAYAKLVYITDKDAFDRLYETIEAQHAAGKPFFTAMYTLGTHVSFDSPDLQFGDGSDPEINKFHNLDSQMGGFMERFEASTLAEDTLVVITADHATYADKAFLKSFPDTPRAHMEMDRVPLVVYYRGMAPETVDVGGRNSLDLAPTLLDYLDISAPNLFLGDSLFVPAGGDDGPLPFDRCFFDGSGVSKTVASPKEKLSKAEKQVLMARIRSYLAVSIRAGRDLGAYDVKIEPSGDGAALQLSSRYPVDAGGRLWFAVWSMSEGPDNMVIYTADLGDDGLWRCTVPLEAHNGKGVFYIHARVGDVDAPPEGNTVIMKIYYVD